VRQPDSLTVIPNLSAFPGDVQSIYIDYFICNESLDNLKNCKLKFRIDSGSQIDIFTEEFALDEGGK